MRTLLLLMAVVAALPVCAQVFPRIEREVVQKRVAGAPAEKEPDAPTGDTPPEPEVDGQAVLKRYNELLGGYVSGKKDQLRASTRWTDQSHESVRKYLEGTAQLRLGFYEDAAKTFDSLGYTVKKEGEIKTQELRNLVADIKSGKAYYFRMIASVMQDYRNFKDESDLENAWNKAKKEGDKIQKELQTAIDRKKVDEVGGPLVYRAMTTWLVTGKNYWIALWRAEVNSTDKPHNMNSWIAIINATGSRDGGNGEEQAPNCLKRRAAALVLKEFWPTSPYVRGGWADIAAATSHISAFQCDDFSPYLEAREYHTLVARGLLKEARNQADKLIDIIGKLKND
ncbi:MAG: hypothetical protein IPP14_06205 [Planctomycetes bacterium]|nr:hypothetical protein [Planctomycetota bacterium]